MTGFIGFTEQQNFGNALFPARPMGDVINFAQLPVQKWQGELGLPFGCYSAARRVNELYTGSLIEVRRSSDNATQNIGYTADNELDTASLLAFVGAGSGFVRTLYDQVGSNNFTQTVVANQPRIVNAGVVDTVNGKPSMFFDGVNDVMAVASSTATYNWLHNLTNAENTAQILSVCQFGTSSNPNVAYSLIGNNNGTNANVGILLFFDDRAIVPINNGLRCIISNGNINQGVVLTTDANRIIPNQLNIVSINQNRNANLAILRYFGYVNQDNPFNTNTFLSTPSNSNAAFSLQLGGNGNSLNLLLGYVSELYLYRQSQQLFYNLSPYNEDLRQYYKTP
jgi:hypothetical protein